MTYTLRVYEPYEQDNVLEFDTIEGAVSYIRSKKLYLDDCELYLTPQFIDLYAMMCPKTERLGGKAI